MSDPTLAALMTELDTFESAHGPVNVTLDDLVKVRNERMKLNKVVGARVVMSAQAMLAAAEQGRQNPAQVILFVQQAMRRVSGQ